MGRKTNEVKAKERFFRILLSAGFTDITKNFYKEKGYSEEVLVNYSELIKRAFQKGKYIINCDYGVARILFDYSSVPIGFERISDKLIALTIYLSTFKSKSSRTKFEVYRNSVKDLNDIYDAVMTSYPYRRMSKVQKDSIEDARTQLPKLLEFVESFS